MTWTWPLLEAELGPALRQDDGLVYVLRAGLSSGDRPAVALAESSTL
jgi:hypothetical protein